MTPKTRRWTVEELRKLDLPSRRKVRDECLRQMEDASHSVRKAAADVLVALAKAGGVVFSDAPRVPPRIPPRTSRPLEDRVADAKAALYGPTDPTLAARVEGAKRDLYGSQDAATARREQARAFHDIGGPSVEERRRRWDVAVALCGSPATARQRGYVEPKEVV